MGNRLMLYTFYSVVAYLVLINWRGANALLSTTFGGYAAGVRSLQGRK